MTSEQFAYWLQGFGELSDGPPSAEQWSSIKEHLQTVFVRVTATPQIQQRHLGLGIGGGGLQGLGNNLANRLAC